eukprot:4839694-Lingulodinium_polyedra.AAC.1
MPCHAMLRYGAKFDIAKMLGVDDADNEMMKAILGELEVDDGWDEAWAWHGMAWRGIPLHGMAWHGMAWHGVALHGNAWHFIALRCIALHSMAWQRMAWRGM